MKIFIALHIEHKSFARSATIFLFVVLFEARLYSTLSTSVLLLGELSSPFLSTHTFVVLNQFNATKQRWKTHKLQECGILTEMKKNWERKKIENKKEWTSLAKDIANASECVCFNIILWAFGLLIYYYIIRIWKIKWLTTANYFINRDVWTKDDEGCSVLTNWNVFFFSSIYGKMRMFDRRKNPSDGSLSWCGVFLVHFWSKHCIIRS